MRYTCGIDWASDHHDVSIINERGMEIKRMRIADTLEGYSLVLEELSSRGDMIPVSIECKDHLLIEVLMEAGHPVYPINPKSAQRYRDRYNVAGAKTDERDAFALADMLRTDLHKLRPLAHGSREVRKLQLLCKEYETLQQDQNVSSQKITVVEVAGYYCEALSAIIWAIGRIVNCRFIRSRK